MAGIMVAAAASALLGDKEAISSVLALVQHLDGPICIFEDVEGVTHLLSLHKGYP